MFQRTISRAMTSGSTYDTVIMGGGVVGSSVAYHLARENSKQKILVIERDPTYRFASGMLSAGGIRQQFSLPENIKMSMYGAEFLKCPQKLDVNGETPDLQFRENGYLFLARTESGADILRTNHQTQTTCGADWIKLMTPKDLATQFPWLKVDDLTLGAFSTKNEGFFDPWLFLQSLKLKSQELGVQYVSGDVVGANLHMNTSGSPIGIRSINVLSLASASNPQISTFSAGYFVNSSGAWSGLLHNRISSSLSNHSSASPSSIASLPVEPKKRCIFMFQTPPSPTHDQALPPCATPLVVDPTGSYFRPELNRAGSFLSGVSPSEDQDPGFLNDSHLSKNSASFSSQLEGELTVSHSDHSLLFEENIWPSLAERVPQFENIKVSRSWAGFYDYNLLDQNAILGPHSELSNLLLCTGFSGHGLQQSPAAGRAISEMILKPNSPPSLDLSRLSFERIVDKKPLWETGIV